MRVGGICDAGGGDLAVGCSGRGIISEGGQWSSARVDSSEQDKSHFHKLE